MSTKQPPTPTPTATATAPVVTFSKYSKRVILKTILGRGDGGVGLVGDRVVIGGWVKTSKEVTKKPVPPPVVEGSKDVTCVEIIPTRLPFFRSIMKVFVGSHEPVREKLDSVVQKLPPPPPPLQQSSLFAVLQVSDGSCAASLQVLVDSSIERPSQVMPTGTCILAEGFLQQPEEPGKHAVELKVAKLLHVGTVDQDKYPLSKKRLPLDMLRDFSHFRPRTTTVASVARIRNGLTQATHTFFMTNGFLYVQVPIITTADCEGFSEKFHVSTLLGEKIKQEVITTDDTAGISSETVKASIKEKNKQIEVLQRSDSNKEALAAALQDLQITSELVALMEAKEAAKQKFESKASVKPVLVDFSEDFFSRQTYLTVSGRLHLESYARALGNVYSFGPRFQAQKSESKRNVAEMWMVEVEMAFSQLEDAINCAHDLLKSVSQWALDNCSEDLKFLSKRVDQTIEDRLKKMTSSSFRRISYEAAVEVLKQVKDKKFEATIELGAPLTEEHESYLADEIYKMPVIIDSYPKELKPFYVRLNDDGETVAAFDMIVPKVGKLIRASQNEERLSFLTTRIMELGLPKEQYEWYLDLRRHGTVIHSGFSLAFDLLVAYATGLIDVRDVIPFPRSHGKANN
ncbi:Asparagine--tRNA ligase, cytoplasmic 2 [Camellia lanceoleosa]|uniref:Asparagine--tRNA ligase, cytoplasmic 2 n=1 Tax=Camellia lanceoleosa TaxID=1840588 RepID=A0ACC0F706_9ERIC|nr:Asparagine--tRNA ligase, cytoplasmic 2 [Camellia lanceoleosa]